MPRIIYKELRENMSSFKTKTIALIASSLIVAVAGLSFATTPYFASIKMKNKAPVEAQQKKTKSFNWNKNRLFEKPAATKK